MSYKNVLSHSFLWSMLIDIRRLVLNIPLVSFLLLFPAFFIYQQMLSQAEISAFLGGYFGIMSLILLIPLIFVFFYYFINQIKFFGFIDYFFIFLMVASQNPFNAVFLGYPVERTSGAKFWISEIKLRAHYQNMT